MPCAASPARPSGVWDMMSSGPARMCAFPWVVLIYAGGPVQNGRIDPPNCAINLHLVHAGGCTKGSLVGGAGHPARSEALTLGAGAGCGLLPLRTGPFTTRNRIAWGGLSASAFFSWTVSYVIKV
jgi:hypothetical protein